MSDIAPFPGCCGALVARLQDDLGEPDYPLSKPGFLKVWVSPTALKIKVGDKVYAEWIPDWKHTQGVPVSLMLGGWRFYHSLTWWGSKAWKTGAYGGKPVVHAPALAITRPSQRKAMETLKKLGFVPVRQWFNQRYGPSKAHFLTLWVLYSDEIKERPEPMIKEEPVVKVRKILRDAKGRFKKA